VADELEDRAARDQALERLRRVFFSHPQATQALFAALVEEGRRYAATPEGARLAETLAGSDLAARARVLWEVLTMSAFVEGSDVLPSVVVDEFARLAATEGLEAALSRVLAGRN
jgi:hypothetical protein